MFKVGDIVRVNRSFDILNKGDLVRITDITRFSSECEDEDVLCGVFKDGSNYFAFGFRLDYVRKIYPNTSLYRRICTNYTIKGNFLEVEC